MTLKQIQKKQLKEKLNQLCKAILTLKTNQECYNFLLDILTPDEIDEISNRLDIAQRLHNKQPYSQIEKETWHSSTTIARVAKFLKWKDMGYQTVLERLNSKTKK